MRFVAFVVILVAAVAPATASACLKPAFTLRIVARSPLTFLGAGLEPGERVVVTALRADIPARTVVVATRAGRFRATLDIALDPCTGPEIIGRRASWAAGRSSG